MTYQNSDVSPEIRSSLKEEQTMSSPDGTQAGQREDERIERVSTG